MSDRFAILVQGIDEPSLITEIEQTIREVFQEMALPGDVRHTLSIAVPPTLLPSLIPRRLEESLNVLRLRERDTTTTTARTLELAPGPTMSTGYRSSNQFADPRA